MSINSAEVTLATDIAIRILIPPMVAVTPLKSYKFIDIFPVAVSAIDLSYDSSDTIEEFTVEFAVQSFESIGIGTAGSGKGDQTGVNLK